MIWYVQRDQNGRICGLFANPQPQPDGTCLTLPDPLDKDDPEVIAYEQSIAKLRDTKTEALSDGQLAAVLVKAGVITQAAVDAAIAAAGVTKTA